MNLKRILLIVTLATTTLLANLAIAGRVEEKFFGTCRASLYCPHQNRFISCAADAVGHSWRPCESHQNIDFNSGERSVRCDGYFRGHNGQMFFNSVVDSCF